MGVELFTLRHVADGQHLMRKHPTNTAVDQIQTHNPEVGSSVFYPLCNHNIPII